MFYDRQYDVGDLLRRGAPMMRFEIDFLEKYDASSMIAEIKRVATKLGKDTVSAEDLDNHGRVRYSTVARQFGNLRKALEAAGLKLSRFRNATDEELIKLLADLWTITQLESGRRPRTSELRKYGIPVSERTIIKRFGTWKMALIATSRAMSGEAPATCVRVVSQRRLIPVKKRFLVIKRDTYRCRMCNRSGVELEVDHIVPVSHGGSDRLDNLQTLCRDCNRGKGGSLE
jgi:hypothetical protein